MHLALLLPDIPLRGQAADSLLIGQAVDRRRSECVFHVRSALMRGPKVDWCDAEMMNQIGCCANLSAAIQALLHSGIPRRARRR